MIRIAICDDSSMDVDIIKAFLEEYYAKKNCFCEISTFANGEELLETYENLGNKFHLLFLDILMDKINGIETAIRIRKMDETVKIVFCTVSPEYAIESYDVFAYGYLVKPFNVIKLRSLLDKFTKSVLGDIVSHIRIKSDYSDRLVPLNDIVFIESNDKVLFIHLRNREVIKTYGKLSSMEEQLNERKFIRCHQSFIVNLIHVTGIEDYDFKTDLRTMVPIRKKDFYKYREVYQKHLMAQSN